MFTVQTKNLHMLSPHDRHAVERYASHSFSSLNDWAANLADYFHTPDCASMQLCWQVLQVEDGVYLRHPVALVVLSVEVASPK